jgi:outer membrane scaffolding protein for murein synthesis (MipA/OmpV family)
MRKFFFLFLACLPAFAGAQTPAARMMPDGSKDTYIGLGISSAPRYKGAEDRDTDPAVLVQAQWSNGVFLSGLSLGMHLSDAPAIEYGPLLAIEPGRHASGSQKLSGIGGVEVASIAGIASPPAARTAPRFTDIRSTPGAGAFFNYYFDENLRLTSNFLYGVGEDHDGLLLNLGVQKSLPQFAAHHRLSLSAGLTWTNRRYMREYFGVDPAVAGGSATYAPSSGVRDVQLTLNWNWELSNLWLLTSQLSATRLVGPAADSPYTDRRNGISVRTGLAYRF